MIDGSQLPFEENAFGKAGCGCAHAVGVSRSRLGKIGGTEDDIVVADQDATMTNPDEAAEFGEAQPDLWL